MAWTYTAAPKPEPQDTHQKSLIGTVNSIRFRNDENGWTVANVRSTGQLVCCVGPLVDEDSEGREYVFDGAWKNDPQWGWQFVFTAASLQRPTSITGISKYLASGIAKGIGDGIAEKIVGFFGERTLEVLDALDVEMLVQVPGVGEAKAEAIVLAWGAAEKHRGLTMELLGKGLTTGLCLKIIKYFEGQGIDPLEGLKSDPYALTNLWGIGFLTADEISRKMGIGLFDPRRLKAATIYALQYARDTQGHCYLPKSELVRDVAKLCSIGEEKVRDFIDGRAVREDPFADDDDIL